MSTYQLLLFAGIVVTLAFWVRIARRDSRLLVIYLAALVGAFFGAKVVYLAAEGWLYWRSPDQWHIWAAGKTILGALLGGYLSVEIAKRLLCYKAVTGDWFAVVAPVGIILGRLGCVSHGCCLGKVCTSQWWTLADRSGVPRWPAIPIEIGFNVLAVVVFLTLRRFASLPGQHFHVYLIGYGAFRFAHEFARDTPRVWGAISGYHLAALAVLVLGAVGFVRRSLGTSACLSCR